MRFVAGVSNILVANTWNKHITDSNETIRERESEKETVSELNMEMVQWHNIHELTQTHSHIENWAS